MATFEPPLENFFGALSTQTLNTVTFDKRELKSETTPPQFLAMTPSETNSAEAIFVALFNRIYEKQNLADDSQVRIVPLSTQLVNVISDGVQKVAEESLFTVRLMRTKAISFPNPDDF